MRYSTFAFIATLSATAFAQTETVAEETTSVDLPSIYSVLLTALPSTLVEEALTNADAVSAAIASEFADGSTPTWFEALPTDIQEYLVGGAEEVASATEAAATAIAEATGTDALATASEALSSVSSVAADASESVSGVISSVSESASATGPVTVASAGLAARATGLVGGALVGAAGFVGLLAL